MSSTVQQERIETVVRNILSGSNQCGSLAAAVAAGDADYFRECALPVVEAYEQEAAALRRQRQEALDQAEHRRRALELLVANLAIPQALLREIEPALGRTLT